MLDLMLNLLCTIACIRLALPATYCDLRQCSVIMFKSFNHWKALRLTFTHVLSFGLFTGWQVGHREIFYPTRWSLICDWNKVYKMTVTLHPVMTKCAQQRLVKITYIEPNLILTLKCSENKSIKYIKYIMGWRIVKS